MFPFFRIQRELPSGSGVGKGSRSYKPVSMSIILNAHSVVIGSVVFGDESSHAVLRAKKDHFFRDGPAPDQIFHAVLSERFKIDAIYGDFLFALTNMSVYVKNLLSFAL
jgi:hypothetical protein